MDDPDAQLPMSRWTLWSLGAQLLLTAGTLAVLVTLLLTGDRHAPASGAPIRVVLVMLILQPAIAVVGRFRTRSRFARPLQWALAALGLFLVARIVSP